MGVRQAYNSWAAQYDEQENKTRDLEARSLREVLGNMKFEHCLEIGCGTGKNTGWLAKKSTHVTAVDLSEEMLAIANKKIISGNVQFHQADITEDWIFADKPYQLITFSLVLEHIENLLPIFQKASKALSSNGYLYISELHPFKQYSGSKARFETASGQIVTPCFNHNISDFTQSAKENNLQIECINEYFDDDDRTAIPRIFTLLFRKI